MLYYLILMSFIAYFTIEIIFLQSWITLDINATVFELFQSLVMMLLVGVECSVSRQLEICW